MPVGQMWHVGHQFVKSNSVIWQGNGAFWLVNILTELPHMLYKASQPSFSYMKHYLTLLNFSLLIQACVQSTNTYLAVFNT